MSRCLICRRADREISEGPGVCLNCVRSQPQEALRWAEAAHARSRSAFGLPEKSPQQADGEACTLCANRCRIPEGRLGYCGVRRNRGGRLSGVSARVGNLSWYHDPLPTNCVAGHVCAAETGAGYPQFAYRPGPEIGYTNLAVFFRACNFNCLFCQNWHFRNDAVSYRPVSVEALVADVDDRTACICYFGGDPTPQLPFSLEASRRARAQRPDRILRICWETNGAMHPQLLDEMLELAVSSGGCIKFDLKAWDPTLHRILTGVSNAATLDNFARAAGWMGRRSVPPLITASTLMVPGYIDEHEIRGIAQFIAALSPEIPYSLLAFHPQFRMADLPPTSKALAERCRAEAFDAGLRSVRIGNKHLLK
jgi:pyruvate formate lyase activating enzyme